MATKYFRRADGSYIGGFDVPPAKLAALLPAGAIEVPVAPDHAAQIWDGAKWTGAIPAPERSDVDALRAALVKKGVLAPAEIDAEKIA